MQKTLLKKSFLLWIPFAAIITFVCVLSYSLVQQDIRQSANDPQIQIAEDVSQALGTGVPAQEIVPPGQTVDMATSLDPYVIIFNASGTVLGSSAILNGAVPSVPAGVFASVAQHGEDRFTWQPEIGVRSAAVVDSFPATASSTGGFVLAGRSIREVEIRENNIRNLAAVAWIAGLIAMFIIIWGIAWMDHKKASI